MMKMFFVGKALYFMGKKMTMIVDNCWGCKEFTLFRASWWTKSLTINVLNLYVRFMKTEVISEIGRQILMGEKKIKNKRRN